MPAAVVNRGDIAYIADMPRPPVFTVKKLVALTPEAADAIQDWRFAHRVTSESEAIRQLIDLGLETAPPPPKTPKAKSGGR